MLLNGKDNTRVSDTWPASAEEARELAAWQGAFFARANGMVLLTEEDANALEDRLLDLQLENSELSKEEAVAQKFHSLREDLICLATSSLAIPNEIRHLLGEMLKTHRV